MPRNSLSPLSLANPSTASATASSTPSVQPHARQPAVADRLPQPDLTEVTEPEQNGEPAQTGDSGVSAEDIAAL